MSTKPNIKKEIELRRQAILSDFEQMTRSVDVNSITLKGMVISIASPEVKTFDDGKSLTSYTCTVMISEFQGEIIDKKKYRVVKRLSPNTGVLENVLQIYKPACVIKPKKPQEKDQQQQQQQQQQPQQQQAPPQPPTPQNSKKAGKAEEPKAAATEETAQSEATENSAGNEDALEEDIEIEDIPENWDNYYPHKMITIKSSNPTPFGIKPKTTRVEVFGITPKAYKGRIYLSYQSMKVTSELAPELCVNFYSRLCLDSFPVRPMNPKKVVYSDVIMSTHTPVMLSKNKKYIIDKVSKKVTFGKFLTPVFPPIESMRKCWLKESTAPGVAAKCLCTYTIDVIQFFPNIKAIMQDIYGGKSLKEVIEEHEREGIPVDPRRSEKFNFEKHSIRKDALVKVHISPDAQVNFLITHPANWEKLGPAIMEKIRFVNFGRTNVKGTLGMTINVSGGGKSEAKPSELDAIQDQALLDYMNDKEDDERDEEDEDEEEEEEENDDEEGEEETKEKPKKADGPKDAPAPSSSGETPETASEGSNSGTSLKVAVNNEEEKDAATTSEVRDAEAIDPSDFIEEDEDDEDENNDLFKYHDVYTNGSKAYNYGTSLYITDITVDMGAYVMTHGWAVSKKFITLALKPDPNGVVKSVTPGLAAASLNTDCVNLSEYTGELARFMTNEYDCYLVTSVSITSELKALSPDEVCEKMDPTKKNKSMEARTISYNIFAVKKRIPLALLQQKKQEQQQLENVGSSGVSEGDQQTEKKRERDEERAEAEKPKAAQKKDAPVKASPSKKPRKEGGEKAAAVKKEPKE